MGEAGSVAAGGSTNKHGPAFFATIRFIVKAGCSIDPLGYTSGYLMGGIDDDALTGLQSHSLCEQNRFLLSGLVVRERQYR